MTKKIQVFIFLKHFHEGTNFPILVEVVMFVTASMLISWENTIVLLSLDFM